MRISPMELGIVIVVVVGLFGGAIIPKVTKQLKKSKEAFKASVVELKDDEDKVAA